MTQPPIGKRFSQVYLEKGVPTQDSLRARKRMSSWLQDQEFGTKKALASALGRSLGWPNQYLHLADNLMKSSVNDFLDLPTIVFLTLTEHSRPSWLAFARSVYAEENLSYRLDDKAGVHYRPDENFERSREATISGLGSARYAAARQAFEEGQLALIGSTPDTLNAVRRTFDAVENIFKMLTGEPRLGSPELLKS